MISAAETNTHARIIRGSFMKTPENRQKIMPKPLVKTKVISVKKGSFS